MMAWQCMKCLHHIPNGVSHSCINDELRDLKKQYADSLKMLEEMAGALDRANYQGDYYDQKPHKAMEVVYSNREALEKYKQWKAGK